MCPFKQFFHYTHQEEQLVALSIQEMELPTPYLFMKVMHSHMLLLEVTSPEETLHNTSLMSLKKPDQLLPHLLNLKLLEQLKKKNVTLL